MGCSPRGHKESTKRLSSSRAHASECSHPSLGGSQKQECPLLCPQPQAPREEVLGFVH